MLLELLPEGLKAFGNTGEEGIHPLKICENMSVAGKEGEKWTITFILVEIK